MSILDDIIKKSTSGTKTEDPIKVGNLDTIYQKSRTGIESNNFNFNPLAPEPTPTTIQTPKPSLLNRATNAIEGMTDRPKPEELGTNATKNAWKYLPSSIVENLPFGVGEIIKQARDNPETVANVKFDDVLQGVIDTSKGVYKGVLGTAASLAGIPLKFNVPGLGEVTNIQYNAAQRIAAGESTSKVILEEGVVNNIFGVLMLAGLAQEIIGGRPTTIKSTQFQGETPGGIKVKDQPRSFRAYEEPVGTQALPPEVVNKLGVDLGPKYNPDLPTYFKITGTANGTIKGEIVQIKPSYLETFLNKFGTDITKTPDNMIVPLATRELSPKQLATTKINIVPETTPTIISKTAIAPKIEEIIPAIKNSTTPDEHLISTARGLAEESGDKTLVNKVEEAIALSEKNIKTTEEVSQKMDEIIQKSEQTPEKQLTEPVSEPYRPARARPESRVYDTERFITGEFEGKPYSTDAFILEFNTKLDIPRKKGSTFPTDAPKEEAVKRIIPDQTEAVPVKPVEVRVGERSGQAFVQLEGDGITLDVQQKYYDYFNKKYPNTVFMAVEPTKPIVVTSKGNMVGLLMPVNPGALTGKFKTTWKKAIPVQPKLKNPTDQKQTPAQKKIKELETKNKKLEEKVSGLSNGELGSLASPHGNKTIKKIIERQAEVQKGEPQVPPSDFKLSARAKQILEEMGIKVSEKTLSSRLLGVYKPLTDKVRVQALYDVTTVTHEAIHAIDHQLNFSKDLIENTERGAKIRKRLTDIYEEIYPQGKRTHKLEKRIKEGLATFFENYFYDPASITAKYPDLVDSFIKPSGQYYTPEFTKLLEKMNELVDDYAKLSPEERIGSRIRTGKEVVDKQTGFNWKQRIEYELFNRFEPLKRYAQKAGVSGTWDDPLVQAFNILNKNSIVTNWVKGENTPILMKDGNFKIEKGSVADYLKLVKGDEKAFRAYLVARRVVADNNTLNELKNLPEEQRSAFTDKISKLEKTIQNDDFSLQDATAVVEKYADKFKEAEKIYDDINKRLIDFSEENGLLDSETAKLYKEEKGYASFRRYIDEELQSVGTIKTSSKSKVTSFKERTGSQLDIIDPIYNQITSINEIIGKGMENRLWERVANLANKDPEISQRFEKISPQPAIDGEGRVSFPQEKDPGVVRIFKDGKREFYKVAPEFAAITKQLRGKEFDAFVQFLRIPSSTFTRLTTSANPIFAAGNLTVDQFSALAQTKTGFKPIVDPIKSFKDYVTGDAGIQAYIAMGGKRQTLASFYDLSPEDVAHKLTGGETKFEKVANVFDAGLSMLELPSNTSEIMTRYSEFARAKAMGKTDSEAMYMASEVTTPFQLQGNIGGRFGQEVIKSIPYFNAAIQVFYKFGRAAQDDPKRVSSVIAGLLTLGLTAAAMTYKSASDKQKRLLAEQPVRNLSSYLYFPSPDGDSLIKVKIPQQMGVLSGMGYLFMSEHYDKNKATFDDYVDVVSSSIPEQVQFYRPKNMLLSWLPQVIKPSIHVASNTKTFPDIGPIVPPYMVDKAPKEQYNVYTSDVAKTIGNLLGTSPTLTEFWLRNQFGVVGGAIIGKLPGNPLWIQEKDYVMAGRSYNRFYDNRTLVQQKYDEVITNDKTTQKYSQEEKYAVKEEHAIYDKVSTLLTEMRDINKTQDLPENIKKLAFDVLLNIDSTENIRDVEPLVRDLSNQIQNFKSK